MIPSIPNKSIINPSKIESNNVPSGPSISLIDILILLMHYPKNSFHLNPWEIIKLINRDDDIETNPNPDITNKLTFILKEFGEHYNITLKSLSLFFASYYQTLAKQSIETSLYSAIQDQSSLNNPLMRILVNSKCLKLLSMNEDILKWEYSRAISLYPARKDPFTQNAKAPFICSDQKNSLYPNIGYLSKEGAFKWIKSYLPLSESEIEAHFTIIMKFSGKEINYLTFSTFIIFSIRCFLLNPIHVKENINTLETFHEEALLSEIRKMLYEFSIHLTIIQKKLKLNVLPILYNSSNTMDYDQNKIKNRIIANILEISNEILTKAMDPNQYLKVRSQFNDLPPRPPAVLWDGPRFIEICKAFGLFNHHLITLDMIWLSYGVLITNENVNIAKQWGNEVSPMPLQISENVILKFIAAFEMLIKEIVNIKYDYFTWCLNPSSDDIQTTILSQFFLPSIISFSFASDSKYSNNKILLEDLIRLGGGEMMTYFSIQSIDFLERMYTQLKSSIHPMISCILPELGLELLEIPMNIICNLFSCNNLLNMEELVELIKDSLHFRFRCEFFWKREQQLSSLNTNQIDPNEPNILTFSFGELQELFIRSAYFFWKKFHPANKPPQQLTSIQRKTLEIYYQEWIAIEQENSLKINHSNNKKSWGINFLKPYQTIVEQFCNIDFQLIPISEIQFILKDIIYSKIVGSLDQSSDLLENHGIIEPHNPLPNLFENYNHSIATPGARIPLIQDNSENEELSSTVKRSNSDSESVSSEITSFSPKDLSPDPIQKQIDILEIAKESLWPIFATYCSCGDSLEPGKLSGPNLFTLLSKLSILTNGTLLTDIGIVLYQIATKSIGIGKFQSIKQLGNFDKSLDSPSLTFEEFLVFLYLFSELSFVGRLPYEDYDILSESLSNSFIAKKKSYQLLDRTSNENWILIWKSKMQSSKPFKKLVCESIIPKIQIEPLLAFPIDARLRDRFSCLFSLVVLQTIESAEGTLQLFFDKTSKKRQGGVSQTDISEVSEILKALRKINLIPQLISEEEVLELVKDVIPKDRSKGKSSIQLYNIKPLVFPQWVWVLAIVAFHVVDSAVKRSAEETDQQRIPYFISTVFSSITDAIIIPA